MVSGGFLYVADSSKGTIERVSTQGGTAMTMATGLPGVLDLAATPTDLFVVQMSVYRTFHISQFPITGGAPQRIATVQDSIPFLSVHDAQIYWNQYGSLWTLALGQVVPVAEGARLMLAGGRLFHEEKDGLHVRALQGGVETIIPWHSQPWPSLGRGVVLGKRLYAVSYPRIVAVPLDGTSDVTEISSEPGWSLSTDGVSLYWSSETGLWRYDP